MLASLIKVSWLPEMKQGREGGSFYEKRDGVAAEPLAGEGDELRTACEGCDGGSVHEVACAGRRPRRDDERGEIGRRDDAFMDREAGHSGILGA